MATLLDAFGVLDKLGIITVLLPILLIFGIVYGLLGKYKPFGDSAQINLLVSVAIALIVGSFINFLKFVKYLVPFLIALIVVLVFIILIFRFLGVSEGDIAKAFTDKFTGYGILIIIVIIVVFIAIYQAFPFLSEMNTINACQMDASAAADELDVTAGQVRTICHLEQTLFNPAVLAIIIMLAIFSVATYMLASN